jgi:hypothetical protein
MNYSVEKGVLFPFLEDCYHRGTAVHFSDSVLAIDRFFYAIPYRDAFVMVAYYAAQVFIAASIGSRVVKHSVNRNNLIR